MAEKKLNARIVHKHDVEANWLLATGFTPKQGEIIVYDIDGTYNYERFKIGDGINNVNDLSFATDGFISYTEQSLTYEQRAQARANIDSAPSAEVAYIDLEDNENIEESATCGVNVSASVGQTIVVKEVDENGKPTSWEAADYQPRTHYDEIVDVVHVEPTTGVFTFLDDEGNETSYAGKAQPIDYGIYTVMYDGTPYVVQLKDVGIVVDGEPLSLHAAGNAKLAANALESLGMSVESVEDSGEPFFVSPTHNFINNHYDWMIISEDNNEHTISITGQTRNLVKLPSKYATTDDIREISNNTAVAGQLCKMNLVGQVERCNASDSFCGLVKETVTYKIKGKRAVVQLGGYVTVPFTGSTPPSGFIKLSSNGEGGVKLDEVGREYLVLNVDNNNHTVTLRL